MRALKISAAAIWFVWCAMGFPAAAAGQTPARDIGHALVGTWTLVSIYEEDELGADMDRWGDNPRGHFVADDAGHFMFQIMGRNVIRLAGALPERACRNTKGYEGIAYAGSYVVDPERRTIALEVDDALLPEFDHSRRTGSISLEGDQLDFISAAETSPTGSFYTHIRWSSVQWSSTSSQ